MENDSNSPLRLFRSKAHTHKREMNWRVNFLIYIYPQQQWFKRAFVIVILFYFLLFRGVKRINTLIKHLDTTDQDSLYLAILYDNIFYLFVFGMQNDFAVSSENTFQSRFADKESGLRLHLAKYSLINFESMAGFVWFVP